jgi:hypothetical protein
VTSAPPKPPKRPPDPVRYVCDWVSPACGDPTTTHIWRRGDREKFLCAAHAATVARHPALTVEAAGADRFPLAVSTAALLGRVA